jgi:hypothetical protein
VLRVKGREPSRSDQESASPCTPMEEAIQQTIGDAQAVFCICRLAYLHSYIHRAVCLSDTFNPHTVQLSRESQATTTAELQSSSHATISTFPTSTREHYARVLHGDVPVHRNVQPNHESKGDATSIESGCERKRVTCSAGYVLSLFVPTKPD